MTTVVDALHDYLESCQADGLSPKTIRWYRSILSAYASSDGNQDVGNITAKDLRRYINRLRGQDSRYRDEKQKPEQAGGYSHATIRAHKTALNAFWAWCAREYTIQNPMQHIKQDKRRKSQPKSISDRDFVRLFNATEQSKCPERDRALLAMLADTGCRLGGLLSMTIPETDVKRRRAIVIEKRQRRVMLFFSFFTAQLLNKWLNLRVSRHDAMWINLDTSEPLTTSGVYELLKRLKRRAGVQGRVNPHSFRHQFARRYIAAGGDISTLSRLMGHESIATTHEFYAVFSEDEIAQFHQKYGSIENWF